MGANSHTTAEFEPLEIPMPENPESTKQPYGDTVTSRTDAPYDAPFKYRMVLKFDGFERVVEGEYPARVSERFTRDDVLEEAANAAGHSLKRLYPKSENYDYELGYSHGRTDATQEVRALKNAAPQEPIGGNAAANLSPGLTPAEPARRCVEGEKGG